MPERVIADNRLLNSILVNFVGNAVKFTSEGSVTASVALDGHGRLHFEVTDTGIGIAPEHQASVFERFQQADSPEQNSIRGTGLGLTICRDLVELLGGEIGVRSVKGQSSTFWFAVPQIEPS